MPRDVLEMMCKIEEVISHIEKHVSAVHVVHIYCFLSFLGSTSVFGGKNATTI